MHEIAELMGISQGLLLSIWDDHLNMRMLCVTRVSHWLTIDHNYVTISNSEKIMYRFILTDEPYTHHSTSETKQ